MMESRSAPSAGWLSQMLSRKLDSNVGRSKREMITGIIERRHNATYLNGGDQKPQLVVSKDRKAVARRSCWLPRGKFARAAWLPPLHPDAPGCCCPAERNAVSFTLFHELLSFINKHLFDILISRLMYLSIYLSNYLSLSSSSFSRRIR